MNLTWTGPRWGGWIQTGIVIFIAALLSLAFSISVQTYGETKNALLVLALPFALPFLLSQKKAHLSLLAIFFFLPIVGFEIPPRELSVSILDILLLFMLLMYFLKSLETGFCPITYHHLRNPLFLLLISCIISSLLSSDRAIAFYEVYRNLKYVIFYWLFVQLIDSVEDLRIVGGLILCGLTLCVLLGLAQNYLNIGVNLLENQNTDNTSFQDLGESVTRVYGPFAASTDFAQYLLMPIFLALGFFLETRKWWLKVLLGLLFVSSVWVLFLTLTRSAITSFFIVFALCILFRSNLKVLIGILLLGGVYYFTAAEFPDLVDALFPSALGARTSDLGADFLYVRLPMWTAAWNIFLGHPLFGVGFLNLLDTLPYYVPGITSEAFFKISAGLTSMETVHLGHVHVDSTFFTWLAEMGGIGLGLVLFIFGRVLKTFNILFRWSGDSEISSLAFSFGMGFLAMLLNMTSIYAYTDNACAILIWTSLGVSTVLARLNSQLPQEIKQNY